MKNNKLILLKYSVNEINRDSIYQKYFFQRSPFVKLNIKTHDEVWSGVSELGITATYLLDQYFEISLPTLDQIKEDYK